MTGCFRTRVKATDTAAALGNPGINVLATPILAGFCEQAAIAACAGTGARATRRMRVSIRHLAPTPVGDEVLVEARITEISPDRIVLSVTGRDSRHDIVSGEIERMRTG